MILRWFRQRRAQRTCFHHGPAAGITFVRSRLIDLGRRKMWWCTSCNRTWFR